MVNASPKCAKPPDARQPSLILLTRECLAILAALFTKALGNLNFVIENEDMQWTILRLAHEQSPIPQISEAICILVEVLNRKELFSCAVSYSTCWWSSVCDSRGLGTERNPNVCCQAGRKECMHWEKSKGLRWTHYLIYGGVSCWGVWKGDQNECFAKVSSWP